MRTNNFLEYFSLPKGREKYSKFPLDIPEQLFYNGDGWLIRAHLMRSTALRCPRLSEELRLFEPGFFFYALGYTPLRPTVLPPLQPPHTPASATAPWFRCAAGSRQARRCLRGTPRQGLPSFRRRLPWYRLPLLSVSVGFSFVLSAIPRCLRLRSVGSPLTCYAIRYATEGTLPQPSPHYGGQSAAESSRRLRSSA